MSYNRGAVVLVPFPFTDLSRQKARPAVVLSPQAFNARSADLIVAAISSQIPATPSDIELVIERDTSGFASTGLRVSSVIRAGKIVTLEQSLIYRAIGQLTDQQLHELDERVPRALGLE